MKKSMLRKVLLLACSAVLLVCLSVGATLAYLTANDTVTNTFTVGNVQINLLEADVKTDGTLEKDEQGNLLPRVTANAYHLLPGHTYVKDPTVTVEGGSEECYVKMTVTFDMIDKLDAIFAPNGANLTSIFNDYDGTTWIFKTISEKDNTRTYEFWYKEKVAKSESDTPLAPLFKSITVPGTINNDQLATINNMTITVNAYAIQADGFETPELAWAAYAAK